MATWAGAAARAVTLVMLGTACARDEPARRTDSVPAAAGEWLVVARDQRMECAEMGSVRACWHELCDGGVCVQPAPLPPVPASSGLGWLCRGSEADRRCVERGRLASPFACEGGRCAQRHPRLPDDGEWLCAEQAGVAICAGSDAPAGVARAPADDAWRCGRRSVARVAGARPAGSRPSADVGDRVCVDFSPDFPDGDARRWRCRWEHEPSPSRVCEESAGEAVLGLACDAASPCVDGARCVAGTCVPPRPSPSCFFDRDCASGSCRFGSCREAP